MIINGQALLDAAPIVGMIAEKRSFGGVTYGLGEAGYDIRIDQTVWLYPFRRFRLASAIERLEMPNNTVAIVHDKSTWARRGLSVFNTVIEPGWCGFLTLELVHHGICPIKIPRGAGIAQVVFHQITCPAEYTGRYQDQKRGPVAARMMGS